MFNFSRGLYDPNTINRAGLGDLWRSPQSNTGISLLNNGYRVLFQNSETWDHAEEKPCSNTALILPAYVALTRFVEKLLV